MGAGTGVVSTTSGQMCACSFKRKQRISTMHVTIDNLKNVAKTENLEAGINNSPNQTNGSCKYKEAI